MIAGKQGSDCHNYSAIHVCKAGFNYLLSSLHTRVANSLNVAAHIYSEF